MCDSPFDSHGSLPLISWNSNWIESDESDTIGWINIIDPIAHWWFDHHLLIDTHFVILDETLARTRMWKLCWFYSVCLTFCFLPSHPPYIWEWKNISWKITVPENSFQSCKKPWSEEHLTQGVWFLSSTDGVDLRRLLFTRMYLYEEQPSPDHVWSMEKHAIQHRVNCKERTRVLG